MKEWLQKQANGAVARLMPHVESGLILSSLAALLPARGDAAARFVSCNAIVLAVCREVGLAKADPRRGALAL